MSIDYIVASLPALEFGAPAPLSWGRFAETCADALPGGEVRDPRWTDLETQLRNAMVDARGGAERFRRPADGCSLYWRNRVLACFQEKDVARREEMLDRVWWDAAEELIPPSAPLGRGALLAYAIRLKIALKRTAVSTEAGNAAFERLTAETRISF